MSSNIKEYQRGYTDGISFAARTINKGGVDALKKEIKFRNISQYPGRLSIKELNEGLAEIKAYLIKNMLVMSLMVLRDEYGFGASRLQRFKDRFMLKTDVLLDDYATWEDYEQILKDECGIEVELK